MILCDEVIYYQFRIYATSQGQKIILLGGNAGFDGSTGELKLCILPQWMKDMHYLQKISKIAVGTQQLLAYEFGLTDTADPLGGSCM